MTVVVRLLISVDVKLANTVVVIAFTCDEDNAATCDVVRPLTAVVVRAESFVAESWETCVVERPDTLSAVRALIWVVVRLDTTELVNAPTSVDVRPWI